MAKKKNTSKKAVTDKPENKQETFEVKEVKKAAPAKFNGGVIIDGIFYKMGEAKSRLLVSQGKAELA